MLGHPWIALVLAIAMGVGLPSASLAAAEFNARVSQTDIALNGIVELSFATTMPTKPDVDIDASVRQSCELREVANSWRLVKPPHVKQYERAKDVHVTIHLMPVRPGTLEPPRIPVNWLEGQRFASFSPVTVRPAVEFGGKDLPMPKEMDEVGGYAWGLSTDEFSKQTGKPVPPDGRISLGGLDLQFAAKHLAAATLRSPGLAYAQARPSLLERWGTPIVDDEEGTIWHLGWITIHAQGDDHQTTIDFSHNGVQLGANRSKVRSQIFDVLDHGASRSGAQNEPRATSETGPDDQAGDDAADTDATKAGSSDDPPPAKPANEGPSKEELEAEFKRALKDTKP